MLDWFSRARRQIPLSDLFTIGTPVGFAGKLAAYALGLNRDHVPADDPTARDPEFVGLVVDAFRALGKPYFRWTVRGIENVPASGPALLVGNHCGGLINTEAFVTFTAIWDRLGPSRVLHGLAHDVLFDDATMRRYAVKFGALRAGHESAHKAFAAGNLVLVYPGSDLDSFRPWSRRNHIELGERKGFMRLALREQVPIVPVVAAGVQEQFLVLTRGDRIARLLRTKSWARTEVFPIVLSVPWGLTSGFLPYIPLPSQTSLAFGEPLRWPDLPPEAADDPAQVDACRKQVKERMQALLDEQAVGRVPWVGQREK